MKFHPDRDLQAACKAFLDTGATTSAERLAERLNKQGTKTTTTDVAHALVALEIKEEAAIASVHANGLCIWSASE